MKHYRPLLYLLSVSLFLVSFSSVKHKEKVLLGHWATNHYMGYYEDGGSLGIGDTITFQKTKFSGRLYHWGSGYVSGIEFKPDSQFVQYRNVMCSDESDIRIGYAEKYVFHDDSIIEIKSSIRDFRFKILYVDSKKLMVRILGK